MWYNCTTSPTALRKLQNIAQLLLIIIYYIINYLLHERFFKIFSTAIFHTLRGRQVLLEGKEYEGLIMTLNNELHKVSTWLDANKLSINSKKTHFMVFHRSRIKTSDINVVMQQNTIDRVNSTKFLGLIIDDKLK